MKKRILALGMLLCLLTLAGCAKKSGLEGRYEAVNPPTESGEMVIKSLEFSGDKVTMISGDTKQTVNYTLDEDTFTIRTKFGDFSYACEVRDDGTLVIDGVDYRRN